MEERQSSRNRDDKRSGKKDFDGQGRRGFRPMRMIVPKGTEIDYKNIAFLQKCVTERGKIVSRRLTSMNASEQRVLTASVKRARFLGLLNVGSVKRK